MIRHILLPRLKRPGASCSFGFEPLENKIFSGKYSWKNIFMFINNLWRR
jgi:hypothetical protein